MDIGAAFWLVALIVLIIIEAMTLGLTTIWFAGGALASFIASLCGANSTIQIALFLVISLLLLIFTRPLATKYINKNRVKTNIDELIGKRAVVTTAIDNLSEVGEAQIEGKFWMARAVDDEVKIEKGTTVTVVEIKGVKLMVKPEN
jgi:Membrane protein implicated in regulation of membrane protease activity